MKARVATFEVRSPDGAELEAFRAFLSDQPGLRGAFQMSDPQTGEALSVTVWDEDAFEAAQQNVRTYAETRPPVGMPQPVKVAVYEVDWSAGRD